MLKIKTRNYGYIAYLIFKYNGVRTPEKDGVVIDTTKTELDLVTEFNKSDFSTYNEILKEVIKG